MKTTQSFLLLFGFLFLTSCLYSQTWREKMDDPSVNFYEVVQEAEAWFETHGTGKGSEWKPYQRWKYENEPHFYPSGDRSQVDPHFVSKAYRAFQRNNPESQEKSLFSNGWNDLGPYRIDSITGHYAAGLGRVEDFWVDPANAQRVYLSSRSGGFWKSLDGGASWSNSTTDYLIAPGVNTFTVDPQNPNEVLINLRNANNGVTHGIYRSTDAGDTWNPTPFTPGNLGWGGLGTNDKINKIFFHPFVPGLVFIGCNRGLYRSTDTLNTWTQLLSTTQITDIAFHPTDTNVVYLYDTKNSGPNEDLLLVSNDRGLTFTPSVSFVGNNEASGYISVSPDCPDCVWFGSNNGVWKSLNKGTTFNFVGNPGSSCDGFAVSDTDTSALLYGYVDVEMSTNSGASWNQVTYWSVGNATGFYGGQYVHADLRVARCVNGVFYVGTDGLLCKSTNNGTTWQIISQGTGIRENYSLGVAQSNHWRSISGSQDNGTSIKHKDSWIEFYGADGMEGVVHPLNSDWMIGSWQNGGRRRTQDAGQNGMRVTPTGQSGSWIAPMFIDPNQQMSVYSFGAIVYKSEDFGSNWSTLAFNPINGDNIQEAAIAYNNTQILAISKGRDILLSTDGGITFTSINGTLPNATITDIAFAPHDDNIIVVTYAQWQNNGNKVFISTDQGSTWNNISYNLQDMPIRCVIIDHTPEHNIYLGAEIGVYTKAMADNNWTFHNTSLPNMTVNDMEIVWGSNTLRAATWGRGLWEYSLVGRTDYPAILTTETTDPVTDYTPIVNNDQYVTSVISYDNTLSSVYVEWSANAPTFGNVIPMSNAQDSTWVSDQPIPQFPEGTDMYFKVFAVGNANDTSETYKFHYKVRPVCGSAGNMVSAAGLTLVEFAGINNATGKTQPFTDYSSTDSSVVARGGTYDLTAQVNSAGFQNIYVRAWMDWNQNGDFSDLGEEYDLGVTANVSDGPTNNSPLPVFVPTTAELGATKMRISARKVAVPFPCLEGFDGEVEEYKIVVEEGVGIQDAAPEELAILAWPNPVSGLLTVEMGVVHPEVAIRIVDLMGRTERAFSMPGQARFQVDLAELASGVYFLRIEADGKVGVVKVVRE